MSEIKLIKEDTDLSILFELQWDVVMNGREYKVFNAPGYVHSIGGHWGENSYWACPREEEPTYKNLIKFSGVACSWGLRIEEMNRCKTKWGETEMCGGVSAVITRNGEDFYRYVASDVAYAYAEGYRLIRTKINEGVICFSNYEYWKDIEGRHIWYRGQPRTLHSYIVGQCCVMAYPGHHSLDYIKNDRKLGICGELKLDLMRDECIDWFKPGGTDVND